MRGTDVATVVAVGLPLLNSPSRPSQNSRRFRLAFVAFLAALIGLIAPGAASAQDDSNSLQSIDPANGASLSVSPTIITLSFNQEVGDDDVLSLALSCNNEVQETGLPEVGIDALVITVEVRAILPKGACVISWRLVDGLGETIVGDTSTFSVSAETTGTAAPDGDAGTTGTTDPFERQPAVTTEAVSEGTSGEGSSGGALWLGRLLSTIGIMVIFGGLALISVGWPEGPEYVVTVRFLRAVWIVGLLGTILYLIAYSADFNGSSFGAAMNPSAWLDLKDDGWTGRGALLRMVFVAATGWVALRPERIIDPTSAMWAWAIPGAALVTVALTRVGGPAAIIGFLVGVVHVFGSAIWIGGAALVARVVLAGPGEEDLVHATRSFCRISMPAVLLTCVTGVIQMFRLDGGQVFTSSHGQVLLLKVVAVAAMLAVALAAQQQVSQRLGRAQEMTAASADRFRRAFGAEATLGIVVLAFSGWMLALTPPRVDPYANQDYTREIPFIDPATGLDTTVFIGPSKVGRNGIRVEIEEPPEGITSYTLTFMPPVGSNVFGIEQTIPLSTAGTAVLPESVGLPFGAAGTWTLTLTASTTTGVVPGAEATFLVENVDGSTPTIPPATTPDVDVTIIDQSTTTAPFATSTTLAPVATTVPPG